MNPVRTPIGRVTPRAIPANAPGHDHGSPEEAQGVRHVWGRDHDDGGRHRQANRQIDGWPLRRDEGTEAVRPIGPGQLPDEQGETEGQAGGQELVEQEALPPVSGQRHDHEHDRPDDQEVPGELPEPAEQAGELLDQVRDVRIERRGSRCRDREDEHGEDGDDQEHDVGGSAGPGRVARRGEDADADAPVLSGCDHGRAARFRLRSAVSLRHRPRCSHAPPVLGRPSARALSRAATLGPLRLEPDRLRPSSPSGRRRDPSLVDWRHHIRRPAPPHHPRGMKCSRCGRWQAPWSRR